jgi:hypothetical protein
MAERVIIFEEKKLNPDIKVEVENAFSELDQLHKLTERPVEIWNKVGGARAFVGFPGRERAIYENLTRKLGIILTPFSPDDVRYVPSSDPSMPLELVAHYKFSDKGIYREANADESEFSLCLFSNGKFFIRKAYNIIKPKPPGSSYSLW